MGIEPYFVAGMGSLFFTIGFFMAFSYWKFKQEAQEREGEIVAIEYYTTTSRSGGKTRKSAYYRPVAEFMWQGKIHKVAGASVNYMRHRLHQKVSVLVRANDHDELLKATIKDGAHSVPGFLFIVMGALMIGVAYFQLGIDQNTVQGIFAGFMALGVVFYKLSNMKIVFKPYQQKAGSKLIDTESEFEEETEKNALVGSIIALVMLGFGLFMAYTGYTSLPLEAQKLIQHEIFSLLRDALDKKLPEDWIKNLVLLGIGVFFSSTALYSLYYTHKLTRIKRWR